MALHNLQQHSMETEENLLNKLRSLELDQATQLNRMMDNIIQSCITKIDDAVYELQSPSHEGNQTASPEYVLSLLEKTSSACGDFGTSFIHFLQVKKLYDIKVNLYFREGIKPMQSLHLIHSPIALPNYYTTLRG